MAVDHDLFADGKWPFKGYLRPSENNNIYITIYNSGKTTVIKLQCKYFYGWGSLQSEEL